MNGGCAGREEQLVALLYEDGDSAELAETRAHLATCAGCRAEFETLSSTRSLLAAWPDVLNVPKVIYVNEPRRSSGGRAAAQAKKWSIFGGLLPSLAAAAAVALVFFISAPFLRVHTDADGSLRLGFGASSAQVTGASALVTQSDLDRGLAQTAHYLETLMQAGREQDRQQVLTAVNQALSDRNDVMGEQMGRAINAAFDEIDRRRRADLGVMLSSMNDLQVITRTELQQFNAMLASLTPAPSADQER
jgi:hypothetical protein